MYISNEKKIKHNGESAPVHLSAHLVPAVYSLHKKQTSVHFILVQFKPYFHETAKEYKIQFHQHLHLLLQTIFDKEYAYCYYLQL